MSSFNTIRGGFSSIGGFIGKIPKEAEYIGSIMAFAQASAPIGWTKQTTYNDCAIRIVSGTPGTGGTKNASSVFGNYSIYNGVSVPLSIQPHTTAITEMSGHTHPVNIQPVGGGTYPTGATPRTLYTTTLNQPVGGTYAPTVAAAPTGHTHSTANFSVSVSSPFNFAVKYVDVILAKYS